MEETEGENAEMKTESAGEPKAPAPETGGGKGLYAGQLFIVQPQITGIPFAFYWRHASRLFCCGSFCSGSVCHTCLLTKTALASLAGFAGLLIYHRLNKSKKTA